MMTNVRHNSKDAKYKDKVMTLQRRVTELWKYQLRFYVTGIVIYFFIFLFILSPLPPLRKGSHCNTSYAFT